MGQFSYICKICKEPINHREACVIYFLDSGEVVEEIAGNYDNYGRADDENWEYNSWEDLVDKHFDKNNKNGFAIIHQDCETNDYKPKAISEGDPNQGLGKITRSTIAKKRYHKINKLNKKKVKK